MLFAHSMKTDCLQPEELSNSKMEAIQFHLPTIVEFRGIDRGIMVPSAKPIKDRQNKNTEDTTSIITWRANNRILQTR